MSCGYQYHELGIIIRLVILLQPIIDKQFYLFLLPSPFPAYLCAMQKEKRIELALENIGISDLKEMQQLALGAIVANSSTLILSPTGSGKTLAFLLPILQLLTENTKQVQCLILTPSRELALQIEQVWKKMATGFKVNSFYGGHDMQLEWQSLSDPPAVLIGTPGRIADHLDRETFNTNHIQILVLDEFDKSLELGFQDQMAFIIEKLAAVEKRVLVSATQSEEIPDFTGVSHPAIVNCLTENVNNKLQLFKVVSPAKDKIDTLFQLLCFLHEGATLIFCNHREATERIQQLLHERDIETACFHGGMEQMQREQTLVQFRNGSVQFMIATDLAARGLDIPDVKHIIHYHLPSTADEFTHRNGRTARMNATGKAYILMHHEEQMPTYILQELDVLELPKESQLPKSTKWETIFINAGKKDKVNKMDIVGFLLQKGKLKKEDLGLIEVKDHVSFVAVHKTKTKEMLKLIREEKMKGKKYIFKRAR